MVHSCSVYGCLTTAKLNRELRFHRFPRDARSQTWIDACRRPDLKNKTVAQLYNMYVCSLHFETWMYKKKKLQSAAMPVLNLPPASIYDNPTSTQTEAPIIQVTKILPQDSSNSSTTETEVPRNEIMRILLPNSRNSSTIETKSPKNENTIISPPDSRNFTSTIQTKAPTKEITRFLPHDSRVLTTVTTENESARKYITTVFPSDSSNSTSIATQTEAQKIEIAIDLNNRDVQQDIHIITVGVSDEASTNAQTQKITKQTADHYSRKRKVRKEVKTCVKKLKLAEDAMLKDITRQQFLQVCDKFLSPKLSKIVKDDVNLKAQSTNNRYSKEFKFFCLNIYYSNPDAYRFLSKTVCLPSKRTLASLAIPVGTKISGYIWDVLSQAIKHLPPFERDCTFCIDEISLESSLFYDAQRDKIIGLQEIDDIQSPSPAGYAFTIMLRGILGSNWKQVVGYAFITSNKIDASLDEWIVNTIKQLFALGFNIRAVVSNQQSNFVKFSKLKGIAKENPYFEIDGNKIYYIFDVPHLIKCARNIWINYDFEFNGRIASWDDINECFQLDKEKDFRYAPKLTDSHISPKALQKQKVGLATQVLSNTVKTAVETYTKAGDLNPHDGTVEFIDTMDKLFDLLNSNDLYSTKPYSKPYQDSELQRNLLFKALTLLSSLKVRNKNTGKDVTNKVKFINAFSVTINAIIQLYDDLKEESGFDEFYLLTRRLNNESLELFFSIIRQANGNCRKSTCIQFERAFRKSFLCQIFKLCSETNYAVDFDDVLSQYTDFTQSKSIYTRAVATRPISETPNYDIPEKDRLLYICGYVLRRCVDKHKCSSIVTYASSYIDVPTMSNSFGGPQVAPSDFIEYCNELETQFRQHFRSFVGNNILKKLCNILSKIEFKARPCSCFPQAFMIRLFIRMRIQYILKFNIKKIKTLLHKK